MAQDRSHGARSVSPAVAGAVAGGLALGAAALFNTAAARRAERRWPPPGRLVRAGDLDVHFVAGGRGQPVVFLHGNGSGLADFNTAGVLARAAARYRVFAFDRPGFGHTRRPRLKTWTPIAQADLLHEVFARLFIGRPVIVAHSFATLVALAFASRYPEETAGLVLLSGYYYPTPRIDSVLLSPPAWPVVGDVMRYTVSPLAARALMGRVLHRVFAPNPIPETFLREFPLPLALRPSQLRAAAAESGLLVPSAARLRGLYPTIAAPTAILVGTGDQIVDPDQSRRLAAALPDAELTEIPGAGHMIHHSAPDRVLAAIDRTAARTDQAAIARETA